MAMPQQQFGGTYLHDGIPAMAAAYAFHICKNHPFADGNKRAGTAAMIAFLSDNGWSFDATADEAEPVILSLASGHLSKEALTTWLAAHCHEKPRMELRRFFESIRLDHLRTYFVGITAGGLHEFSATGREAISAMPVIFDLGLLARGSEFDEAGRKELVAYANLLVALYRVAEDMGYEW